MGSRCPKVSRRATVSNCEEAFKFYQRVLGGTIEAMVAHAGTPAEQHTPPEWRDKILHARLAADGATLMGSDDRNYQPPPRGMCVALQVKTPEQAERIFAALAENGKVQMPIQQTFFAARFGMLTDRFGIPWMVNYEQQS
ncbi:MAG TPA: VOC family protein [Bryobacteraceae bacterium]|nr:VOC family protein [Bryobacteraceae bacterium]